MLAGTPAIVSAFGKQEGRKVVIRTSMLPGNCKYLLQLYPADQNLVSYPNIAAREAVIYSGWPCT